MAASVFSLTKVIHKLAYSFFAPTIYVWIICQRGVCADQILSFCFCSFVVVFLREESAVCISLSTADFFQIPFTGLCVQYEEWSEVIVLYLCLSTSLWLNKKESQVICLWIFLIFFLVLFFPVLAVEARAWHVTRKHCHQAVSSSNFVFLNSWFSVISFGKSTIVACLTSIHD